MPPSVADASLPIVNAVADFGDLRGVRPVASRKLLVLSSLAGLAVLIVVGIGVWKMTGSTKGVTSTTTLEPTNRANVTRQLNVVNEASVTLTDSPEELWARPEFGQPIELRFMPMGVQTIVRLRLAKLSAHPEGARMLRSLGPVVGDALNAWLQQVGVDRSSLETLTLGLLAQGTTFPKTVAVGNLVSGNELTVVKSFGEISGERTARRGENAFWFPEDHNRTLVFGPHDVLDHIRTASDSITPFLRRELEQLRQATHDTDHVTILANPNFLRDEAQGLFSGSRRRLLDALYGFWSDHAKAVSLGVQLSDVAVVELRMIAREDWSQIRLSNHAKLQVESLSSRASDFLGRVQLDPYWQPLAMRFPTMLRFVSDQTRIVIERRQVVVSTALPVEAVHNLLLASELTLASPVSTFEVQQEDRSAWTMEDVLARPMTVRVAQKSLDFVTREITRQVQDDIRGLAFEFTIEIIDTDLQSEGITRNQQIHDFNEVDRSLSEILTALVMKANSVQTVTKASDFGQKLVWVLSTGNLPRILITTRTVADRKQWILPKCFLE